MEVHHHSHTARKKVAHYFWEFFMLFLAVSLGFLVENMREHRTESRREKALMKAMLLDLDADIRQINSLTGKRKVRNVHCDSLIRLLANSDKTNGALIYFYGRNASRRIHFRPQDGVLQQIRTSGGFRVIHNTDVLTGINNYEISLKNNLENIEVEEKELSEYSGIAAKLFNVTVFQEMTLHDSVDAPAGNPALMSYDRTLLNELAIKLHYWKRTSLSILESWEQLKKEAATLIDRIKEEYHLK